MGGEVSFPCHLLYGHGADPEKVCCFFRGYKWLVVVFWVHGTAPFLSLFSHSNAPALSYALSVPLRLRCSRLFVSRTVSERRVSLMIVLI